MALATLQTHYRRQYMARVRRKLEPDPARPRHLLTEPGTGYRFQPSDIATTTAPPNQPEPEPTAKPED